MVRFAESPLTEPALHREESIKRAAHSNMPDESGYLASEWSGHIEVPIVLLEKIH
jgi:hypothetical protein